MLRRVCEGLTRERCGSQPPGGNIAAPSNAMEATDWEASPTAAVIGSESVRTVESGSFWSYDGGKKIIIIWAISISI